MSGCRLWGGREGARCSSTLNASFSLPLTAPPPPPPPRTKWTRRVPHPVLIGQVSSTLNASFSVPLTVSLRGGTDDDLPARRASAREIVPAV